MSTIMCSFLTFLKKYFHFYKIIKSNSAKKQLTKPDEKYIIHISFVFTTILCQG